MPRSEVGPDVPGAAAPRALAAAVREFLDAYVRLANGLMGGAARRAAERNPKLRLSLEQAHMNLLPETFTAVTWLNSLLAGAAVLALVSTGLGVAALAGGGLPRPPVLAVLALLPIFAAAAAYVSQAVYPDYRAGERKRGIDANLPYAVNYVAAMSSAGVVPATIVRDLARQPVYGEVSREFAWMARDLDLLGMDLVTAINRAIARSPSLRLQEFLQGTKTSLLSGGDLKGYFVAKAEQYMQENRRSQKEFLDGLGVLAESYVTVVIAGPLFMLVLLSIMVVIGKSAAATEFFLFALVFTMLPITHIAFAWIVKNMTPEV